MFTKKISPVRKTFLKWAGNKSRVLPHLLPHIGSPKRYCEPFGGSLAVALNVGAESYMLNDVNKDLVSIYRNLLDYNDDFFIQYCAELFVPENNNKEAYMELRKLFNESTNFKERARLFIYLNRHCFNGLSRYNRKGEFNVPFGKYDKPSCPSAEMMDFRMFFLARKSVRFTSLSFESSLLYEDLGDGDVVYFDPPYVPLSDTANFTNYSTEGFSEAQQVELAQLAQSLQVRGVRVIISNHDVDFTRELYKGATIYPIQVSRTIAAKKSSRKKANELIAVF
jgi:DNA adenine methylase